MNDIKKLFGKRLKTLREGKLLTQEKFAEKIDISSRALSAIECGKNFVSAETITKICLALEVAPKQLFDFDFKYKSTQDAKKHLIELINGNEEHILKIYEIIEAYLK